MLKKISSAPLTLPIRFLFITILTISVAGCETLAELTKPAPVTDSPRGEPPVVRLQAGDKAKVVVYGEDRMSGDFEVDSNGQIVIPLLGPIRAVGMGKRELERAIVDRLKNGQILKNPVVTVDISAFRPFYVLGEVEKPGEYAFRNGLNAMSAVAVAGGYTYRASKSKVLIQRSGEKAFTEYALSPNIPIYPGDLISVPERFF